MRLFGTFLSTSKRRIFQVSMGSKFIFSKNSPRAPSKSMQNFPPANHCLPYFQIKMCAIFRTLSIYSCYVKFKGLNPRFHVFFVFSRFLNSFLSFEDKNPPSAISCSPFYVKLFLLYFSIKKSDTVIGGGLIIIRSPTRMGPQLVGVGLLCV